MAKKHPGRGRRPSKTDPLQVPFSRLPPEGENFDEVLGTAFLQDILETTDFDTDGEGRVRAHVIPVDGSAHVRGRWEVPLKATCTRCLEPIVHTLSEPFEVTLFRAGDEPPASSSGEIATSDLGVATFDGETVHLGELMRDEMLLALPMHPACFSGCGSDADDVISAQSRAVDTRWSGLAALRATLPNSDVPEEQ